MTVTWISHAGYDVVRLDAVNDAYASHEEYGNPTSTDASASHLAYGNGTSDENPESR